LPEKAVGYVRVSRADENPENQEYVIRKYCEEHGLDCLLFPPEVEVSRLADPFERPVFRQILDFMAKNNIPILVVESIDRLTAEPEHWDKLIRFFAEKGWRIVFVRDERLTDAFESTITVLENLKRSASSEVVRQVIEHQIKQLMDFVNLYQRLKVAVAKDYVEDVRRKTKRALERLKAEGKVYTKPSLIDMYALYLTKKQSFKELTREDRERTKLLLFERYGRLHLEGVPVRKLWRLFLENEKLFVEFLKGRRLQGKKNTYLSYSAFYRAIKNLVSERSSGA